MEASFIYFQMRHPVSSKVQKWWNHSSYSTPWKQMRLITHITHQDVFNCIPICVLLHHKVCRFCTHSHIILENTSCVLENTPRCVTKHTIWCVTKHTCIQPVGVLGNMYFTQLFSHIFDECKVCSITLLLIYKNTSWAVA